MWGGERGCFVFCRVWDHGHEAVEVGKTWASTFLALLFKCIAPGATREKFHRNEFHQADFRAEEIVKCKIGKIYIHNLGMLYAVIG